MTPRRNSDTTQPEPTANGTPINDDLRQYEVDGWRVGYAVQLQGIGLVPVGDAQRIDDDDSPFVSDDEGSECAYAGYQSIPSGPEEEAATMETETEEHPEMIEEEEEMIQETERVETQAPEKVIKQKQDIKLNTNDIALDDAKVLLIREAMGSLNLPPPPGWESADVDAHLKKIIKDFQSSNNPLPNKST